MYFHDTSPQQTAEEEQAVDQEKFAAYTFETPAQPGVAA